MFVNYYISTFLISVCFSFSVGKIRNEEYASKNEADYVVNKHPGLDGNASAPAVNITEQPRLCKEESIAYYSVTPEYSMDDVSLNHYGKQKRNSTGHRTYFELHFAVQTDGELGIYMTEKDHYDSGNRCQLSVGQNSNKRTRLYFNALPVQDIVTPDLLSSTKFRSFYIKIDDGKLQFGKEGDAPIMSYADADLSSFNYYRFGTYGGSGNIRFCPAAFEGSS